MISGGSFETGMQVERLFEDKWYPAYVSRTSSYQGITDTVDLRYARGCFGEEEELNVSTSFLRHANFENQSPSSSAYSPPQSVMYGSRRPHKVWRIKQTPVEELMTRDDIGVRGLRKLRESRRGSSRYRSQSSPPCNTASLSSCRFHVSKNGSSSSVLAPKVDSSLEGLKPLCDRCERCGKHSIFRYKTCLN